MSEQPPSAIGTVAQEAARLIEDMASMARSGSGRSDVPGSYAGGPAQQPRRPGEPRFARPAQDPQGSDDPSAGLCSSCGNPRDKTRDRASDQASDQTAPTPASCKLCPLCRGIALLRAVRPETVDLLADLALAMAASLREVATRSRASDPASSARSASGGSREGERVTVQDIPVDDDSEGWLE